MVRKDVKYGAIFSYILIIMNSLYGVLITPYTISYLGVAEYGVYKTISSFTAAFVVLDFGIGSTMIRYIAKFRVDHQEEKIPNYIAMCLMQAIVLIAISAIVLFLGYQNLESIYEVGLTPKELSKAKQLYIVLAASMCLHILSNVFSGIIKGYNKFSFSNGFSLFFLVFRVILILVLIPIVKDSLVLVVINLVSSLLCIVVEFIYAHFKLKVRIKFTHWDGTLFKESFIYTILMFITTVEAQVNNSLDNVVIGAFLSSTAVAIYSVGLLVFNMFEHLSSAISSVMLPTVIETMKTDDKLRHNTQSLIVSVGRIQFILLGAALVGFVVVGKEFLELWMGESFGRAYGITIILMIPSLFELCVNVCLAMLRAENKIGFRTFVVSFTMVLNLIVTIVGTRIWGYYAAAFGTAIAFFLGSDIIMNVYYYKHYHINMIKIYGRIFKKIWVCLIFSGIACYFAKILVSTPLLKVMLGITAFVIVYGITLLLYGLDEKEKELLKLNKFIKGVKKNG